MQELRFGVIDENFYNAENIEKIDKILELLKKNTLNLKFNLSYVTSKITGVILKKSQLEIKKINMDADNFERSYGSTLEQYKKEIFFFNKSAQRIKADLKKKEKHFSYISLLKNKITKDVA